MKTIKLFSSQLLIKESFSIIFFNTLEQLNEEF